MSFQSHVSTPVASLREANKLQFRAEHDAERVRSAALVAVWLLIPFAIGAIAYLILGFIVLFRERLSEETLFFELTVPFLPWLILTLVLQAAYWAWLSDRWEKGLWALIPLVGLIPTFMIARTVLLSGQKAELAAAPPGYPAA
jgi:hypothetical protein